MAIEVEAAIAGSTLGRTGPAIAGTEPPPFAPLEIAADRCKGCGLCIAVCPKHVLELDRRAS